MAGGGTKPIEIKSKFDPRVTTLREVVDLYAKDARAAGRKIEDFEKTFNLAGLKDMLDRPAIDMFEGSWDGDLNPLEAALQGKAESTHRSVISAVSNVQRNVIREATRLKTGSDLIQITDTVYIPPKSKAYTKSFGYNPYKIGFLTEALVKHVKDNPADKPIANAIMFQLQTGLRPSAVGGLPTASFKTSERPGGSPGIFIPKDMKGVKTDNNINVPLSRRSIAILQDQTIYNEAEFGDSEGFFVRRVGNKVESITDTDINRVLKKLNSSFGIKKDLKTVDTKDVPYLTSYDLRRLNATAFDQLGVDVNRAGALVGRPIQANTEQSRYIGAAPGVYGDSAAEDVNRISNFFHQQYAETLSGASEAGQQGKSLSLNTMLFDGETPEFTDIETEAPAPIKIKKFDVGTNIQVEEKGPVKQAVPSPQVADDLMPAPNPEAAESLRAKGFDGKKMADAILNFVNNDTTKAVTGVIAGAGSTLAAMVPGPVEALVTGVFDQKSLEEAGAKGKKLVQDVTGQEEGVLPALGEVAGVAGEMVTGAVADREAPLATSKFLASPMATIASGFINRNEEATPVDMNTGGFLSR